MLKQPHKLDIAGPVGKLETIFIPAVGDTTGIAVICHPNPTQGGTNTNKVIQTAAKSLSQLGYACYLPNLRGVGHSEGEHDYGAGEVDDVLAVVAHARAEQGVLPLALAGFSFGAFVASHGLATLWHEGRIDKAVLVGTAASRFEVAPVPPEAHERTLVVHGEQDDTVPLAAVMDWARPQILPVTVVPGGGHFFHGQLPLLKGLVMRHLLSAA